MTERFIIGLAGAPFGLKGFVKVRPFSGDIEHLLTLRSLVVRQAGKERALQIEESAPSPPVVLMKFAGIDSPEAAGTLRGAELLVDREQASPLGRDEFYVEDLRGLVVMDEGGEILGHITYIIEGGGGDLVEIMLSPDDGHTVEGKTTDGELRLVPFRREFFTRISPEEGQVVLINRWILE
ncbi:MAG: ribosome maturation factor RimM [Treponema sp.]|nr:ribosome maturation factor RimM [Treponema sp.]